MSKLPQYSDILNAAAVLEGKAVRTPLISNSVLNDRVGGQVFLKPECLQKTGRDTAASFMTKRSA